MKFTRLLGAVLTATAAHAVGQPADRLDAQERTMHHAEDFDPERAILGDEPMFDPFHVQSMQPLRDALADRIVAEDTPLLVIERGGTTVAVITYQMAYHHVAQGDVAGEPWLVAF